MNILVYGYGNTNRQDDALASSLITALEARAFADVRLEWNYLLNIDDASYLADHDCTIFVDATREEAIDTFSFTRLTPAEEMAFSTHRMDPESVLAFCGKLYDRTPPVYLLAIRGYAWEFKEGLTPGARENLSAALAFLTPLLAHPSLEALDAACAIKPFADRNHTL